MKKNISASLAVLFSALGLTSMVWAAEPNMKYPVQPVKIVVPYTPGGISDLMGRSLASYLEKKLEPPMSQRANPMATLFYWRVTPHLLLIHF